MIKFYFEMSRAECICVMHADSRTHLLYTFSHSLQIQILLNFSEWSCLFSQMADKQLLLHLAMEYWSNCLMFKILQAL